MLIGIAGHLEAGKTTLAKEIQKHQKEGNVSILAFAKPLKSMCAEHFGFSYNELYTTEGKMKLNSYWNMTPREFMQRLGQGLREAICPDVWVKLMEVDVLKKKDIYTHVIIDDCRMPNEVEMIHKLGGVVIRVTRPNHTAKTVGIKNHPSECELPDEIIDYDIVNDRSIEHMYDVFHLLLPNV